MSELRMKIMLLGKDSITLVRADGKPLEGDDLEEGGIVYVSGLDEAETDNDEGPTPVEERLGKTGRWADRAKSLMADAALNVNNSAIELIGPDARAQLLQACGGDRQVAAAVLHNVREKLAGVEKAAKGAKTSAGEAGEAAEHLLWAIDRVHLDLLTGQTSIDDVGEDGRHVESGKPKRGGRKGKGK